MLAIIELYMKNSVIYFHLDKNILTGVFMIKSSTLFFFLLWFFYAGMALAMEEAPEKTVNRQWEQYKLVAKALGSGSLTLLCGISGIRVLYEVFPKTVFGKKPVPALVNASFCSAIVTSLMASAYLMGKHCLDYVRAFSKVPLATMLEKDGIV
jgi:hypothetical protein